MFGRNKLVRPPGFEPGSSAWQAEKGLKIDYPALRDDFLSFLESKKFNQRYVKTMLSYLDKNVSVIEGPMDILRVFSGLTPGQQHNLNRGLRNLFNFLEGQGFSEDYLNILRKNIPKDETGIDLRIPSPEQIVTSLKVMNRGSARYRVVYNLALDSGLRLVEATRLIKNFKATEMQRADGFCMVPIGMFRRSKVAYYGFFTDYTMQLISELSEEEISTLDNQNIAGYVQKRPVVTRYKYLRKFAFDKMIELEVPESVADFIQGRTPKSVGAKHYMVLVRQAKKFYPRYADYITQLQQKAGLRVLD